MGTFVGRYKPIAIGTNASYDTLDEQAALFVSKLNTETTGATPSQTTGATAKWVSVPTVAAASSAGATTTYKDDTVIADGVVHLRVTTPDKDSTATVAAVADAIDKAVLGSLTVDGAMASAVTTTFLFHHAEDAVATLLKAAVDHDGFCYMLVGDEAEVIKVTAVDMDTHTITCVRGAAGSTASSSWDDDEPLYWYCGTDNTIVGVDDETVWGTIASHTAAGGHLVVICGTEQMLVTELAPHSIPDTFLCTRGYDGTTAAVHADNAAVTQYIDESTCIFDVSSGAALVDEMFYKMGTGGTEVLQVKNISTNRVTWQRAQNNSPEAVIADTTAIFRIYGIESLDAALTAVNATSGAPDFEEYGGPPVNTLGYNADGSAIWSSETQVDAT